LNLDKIIRYNVIKYVEYKKEEYIDFKMRIKIINVLLERQLINRFRKNAIKNKSNLDLAQINLNLAQISLDLV